jgi:hypothetical protein
MTGKRFAHTWLCEREEEGGVWRWCTERLVVQLQQDGNPSLHPQVLRVVGGHTEPHDEVSRVASGRQSACCIPTVRRTGSTSTHMCTTLLKIVLQGTELEATAVNAWVGVCAHPSKEPTRCSVVHSAVSVRTHPFAHWSCRPGTCSGGTQPAPTGARASATAVVLPRTTPEVTEAR